LGILTSEEEFRSWGERFFWDAKVGRVLHLEEDELVGLPTELRGSGSTCQ